MKYLPFFLICLIPISLFASVPTSGQDGAIEKSVKTSANQVTVFLKGAQIMSATNIELQKGLTLVRFTELSPYIVPQSIQVKVSGQVMVLSVNHQQNYLDKLEKPRALIELETKLEALDAKILLERTHLNILKEEQTFLQENRNVGGKNEQTSVSNLQQALEFYSNRMTQFKLKEIERNKTLQELISQRQDLQGQINLMQGETNSPASEILVRIEATQGGIFPVELTYLVENAGWYPSYDIRASSINEPIQLIYKANLKQDTKMDWTDVKLKFSTANPNASGIAPELETYYLNYNTLPPVYGSRINEVRGRVLTSQGQPMGHVMVSVEGSSIATMTDAAGNYALSIPNHATQLVFSSLGFESRTLPVTGGLQHVVLQESTQQLDEIMIAANGMAVKSSLAPSAEGLRLRGTSSMPVPVVQLAQQTSVEFEINRPYSIKSDNKNYTIDMDALELPAFYQYMSIPKVEKDVFLLAHVADWEKFNLIEGEANVFFENTFVGKTVLDVRNVSDTLKISLGRDRNVLVSREKIKDFTTKRFIGNRMEDHRGWKITVRNVKNQEINLIVLDQVPVSTLAEIEVQVQKLSGAQHLPETGEIKWEFKLKPASTRELDLQYTVKYPRGKTLVVE